MTGATTLGDVAELVRSKNAGPFWLTLDIFCDSDEAYETLAADGVITPAKVATAYRTDPEMVRIFRLADLRVVKVSLPRPTIQGRQADRDQHAGQQHIPLMRISVQPEPSRHG
jgi:hypothetical protein